MKAANTRIEDAPEYLVYSEIYALTHGASQHDEAPPKTNFYMKGVTRIDDLSWINNIGSDLLVQRS